MSLSDSNLQSHHNEVTIVKGLTKLIIIKHNVLVILGPHGHRRTNSNDRSLHQSYTTPDLFNICGR